MADQSTSKSKATSARRAAQYIRMSTEHQQYSTENQANAVRDYAERRGYEIVRTYADEGKSGLRIEGRDQLRQLIRDVERGNTDFQTILVYDISRWGRFQDADESAYYEYVCKRAGIDVQYCAEQFENDGSTQATIFKSVKRAMAGEYSRELSVKVFQARIPPTPPPEPQGRPGVVDPRAASLGRPRVLLGDRCPLRPREQPRGRIEFVSPVRLYECLLRLSHRGRVNKQATRLDEVRIGRYLNGRWPRVSKP